MIRPALLLSAILVTQQAQAFGIWGDIVDKVFGNKEVTAQVRAVEDASAAATGAAVAAVVSQSEKQVAQAGDAAADVVTLGENGRRRDRERADVAAREAQMQREQAEAQRQNKRSELEKSKAHATEMIQVTQDGITQLEFLSKMVETNIKTAQLLVGAQANQSADYNVLREIVSDQQHDLAQWAESLASQTSLTDTKNKEVMRLHKGLTEKVAAYVEQINNIPVAKNETDSDSYLEEALATALQIKEFTRAYKAKLIEQNQTYSQRQASYQQQLQSL